MQLIQPIAYAMCYACCGKRWLRQHFANDWLAGTWLMFWATIVATFGSFVILLASIEETDEALLPFTFAMGYDIITYLFIELTNLLYDKGILLILMYNFFVSFFVLFYLGTDFLRIYAF